jgi:EmrB/QacA subfamily drug resistance transporter
MIRQSEKQTRNTALLVSAMSAFMTAFMGSSVNILLPSIAGEFGMNAMQISWVVTAYILSTAIFLVPFGRLSDIHGRKRIFFYGMCVFALITLLIGLVPGNGIALIALRFAQGLGSAMIFSTGMTIVISVFPPAERGRAIGVNVACVYLGLSVGPFIAGLMTHYFSWRVIFLLTALISALVIILVRARLGGEWADARGESFDLKGSCIYGASLVCLMYGFANLPSMVSFVLIAAGILLFALLVRVENRISDPVLNFSIFSHNRVYALATSSALINYSATFAVGFLMSMYLQTARNMSPLWAGTVMLVQPALQTLFSPLAGRLSDRRDPQAIASTGMALTSAGLFMLNFLGGDTSLFYVMAALALLGLGFAFFSTPNTTAAMNSMEKRYYGVASSLLSTMRVLGQMLSMGISMIVFSIFIGRVRITHENAPEFLHSMKILFLVFALLCFAGIFLKTRGVAKKDPPVIS